jgi:hypothetical protein
MKIPAFKLYFNNLENPSLLEILIYKLYCLNYKVHFSLLYKLIFFLETLSFQYRDKSGSCLSDTNYDISNTPYTQADSFPEKFI